MSVAFDPTSLTRRRREVGYRNQALMARGRAHYCRVHGQLVQAAVWDAKADVWDAKAEVWANRMGTFR